MDLPMHLRCLVVAASLVACAAPDPDWGHFEPPADPDLPLWPEQQATFIHPVLDVPEAFGTPGVFVVGGHGAPGNVGNLGCVCQLEQDFTLDASLDLATRLSTMGVFDVTMGRDTEETPSYPRRLRRLARSGAGAMLELHSDSRGGDVFAVNVSEDGQWCLQADDDPGLAILVSDDGPDTLNQLRLALARRLAEALHETGFLMYDGARYGTLYEADTTPGVFLDRRGLMMLRRPTIPSVLIETHNAKDRSEVDRWSEGRTRDAFGRAVALGLLRYFSE